MFIITILIFLKEIINKNYIYIITIDSLKIHPYSK